MENFKIKRFWSTLRWYFSENCSRLLSWCFGLALIFMAINSLLTFIMLKQSNDQIPQEIFIISNTGINVLIAMLAFIIIVSLVFAPLRRKEKRIAYLTLPATHLEKYITVMVYTLVIWPLFIILAFILGDTLRMVIFGILGHGWISSIGFFSRILSEAEFTCTWPVILDSINDIAFTLWFFSIYILAGTWLCKNVFSLTTLAMIAVEIVFMVFTSLNIFSIPSLFVLDGEVAVGVHPLAYVCIFLELAATAFNFWASYQLFKRFQIITSKWTNV